MLFLRSGKFGTNCAKITKGWDTIWIFLNKFLLSRLCINKFILSQKERKWETEKTIMMNHNNKKITFTFVLTHNTTFFPIKKLFSHKLWSATAAFPINAGIKCVLKNLEIQVVLCQPTTWMSSTHTSTHMYMFWQEVRMQPCFFPSLLKLEKWNTNHSRNR